MILLYAVGGDPSEGETPMETVSSCPSVVVTYLVLNASAKRPEVEYT